VSDGVPVSVGVGDGVPVSTVATNSDEDAGHAEEPAAVVGTFAQGAAEGASLPSPTGMVQRMGPVEATPGTGR
jgi:hypothetical protein